MPTVPVRLLNWQPFNCMHAYIFYDIYIAYSTMYAHNLKI